MKRIAFSMLLIVFLAPGTTSAEEPKRIKQGNLLVGGAANLSVFVSSQSLEPDVEGASETETIRSGFGLDALVGYFVIDGLEVGPFVGVDYDKYDNEDADLSTTTTAWSAGGQLGYFVDFGSIAVPYGLVRGGYVAVDFRSETGDEDATDEFGGYLLGMRLGANIFFSRSIALDLAGFFDYYTGVGTVDDGAEYDYDGARKDYGALVGFNLFF